ncbi:uncharacterized protein LOC144752794 [Lissotriton helveticus]
MSVMQAARQFKEDEEDRAIEVSDRQHCMAIDKDYYPALPPPFSNVTEDPEKDPLMSHLLRLPPPYVQGATAPPLPPVVAPLVVVQPPVVVPPPVASQVVLSSAAQPPPGPPALSPALPQTPLPYTPLSSTSLISVPTSLLPQNTLSPVLMSTSSPSARQQMTETVTSLLSPFFGSLNMTPVSVRKQRRSQLPGPEERAVLDLLARRWVSNASKYGPQVVMDIFLQWEAPKQRYVFDVMCTFLRQEWEDNELGSIPLELINVQSEFAKGTIVGSDVEEAVETLLTFRSRLPPQLLFETDPSVRRKVKRITDII